MDHRLHFLLLDFEIRFLWVGKYTLQMGPERILWEGHSNYPGAPKRNEMYGLPLISLLLLLVTAHVREVQSI